MVSCLVLLIIIYMAAMLGFSRNALAIEGENSLLLRIYTALTLAGEVLIFVLLPFLLVITVFQQIAFAWLRNDAVDDLTQLHNRRGFGRLFARCVSSLKHSAPACLVMCDVDNFKSINDSYGHLAGDAVLKKFAEILKGYSRKCDIVGRFGGDEFILLLPGRTREEALDFARGLRGRLACSVFVHNDKALPACVTASFGVVELVPCESLHAVTMRADAVLYLAKAHGRNCVMGEQNDPLLMDWSGNLAECIGYGLYPIRNKDTDFEQYISHEP
ncbi:GGDEF domain-containing protein [Allopusillimonas ginsengisoli]|uniref:GGDEF domain-containing protein n=1 Tax=Allopusillimonas ginsengisoli TaxID=453575 RepID=UPI0014310B54|nr:GGDEF domain-containing protein [Allopusillimonas ginsengisoli]